MKKIILKINYKHIKKRKVMKKIILLVLLAILTLNVIAQNQLTGIGILKLYSPISLINELGYNSETKIIKTQSDYFRYAYEKFSGDKIYEIIQDSTTGEGYGGYYSKDIRKFYIPAYKVIPTLEINCLNLVFYKDSLVSIECYGSNELSEALDIKYGKSKLDLKEEDHTFTYTYTGATVVKTDKTFTQTWDTNSKNVSCQSILMIWYSDKAEKHIVNNFCLKDTYYEKKISNIEDGIKKRMEEREELSKKQKYDGL